MKQRGFTLIELLVVISIIGLLGSIVLVAISNARIKSRDTKRTADLKQIATGLELYYSDNGRYPITSGVVNCLTASSTWASFDSPPYFNNGNYIQYYPS